MREIRIGATLGCADRGKRACYLRPDTTPALRAGTRGSRWNAGLFWRTSHKPRQQPTSKSSILLNCNPEEAYSFWRDFENIPRFMRHLESVSMLEGGNSRWVALGPMGSKIEWKAEIVKDEPNHIISWRSQPGSDLDMTGYVEFSPEAADRGTRVTAEMHFHGATGPLAQKLAKALGKTAEVPDDARSAAI